MYISPKLSAIRLDHSSVDAATLKQGINGVAFLNVATFNDQCKVMIAHSGYLQLIYSMWTSAHRSNKQLCVINGTAWYALLRG